MSYKNEISNFKRFIPPLMNNLHKGSNGRIGIIGGSDEYTGAPFFAAISALKAGADLVHVFCCSAAAPVIKSYSPELIVHPLLDKKGGAKEIVTWSERLHALVIGPGLGRDPGTFNTVCDVLKEVKRMPIVLDADGLFMLANHPGTVELLSNQEFFITPNTAEMERIRKRFPQGLKNGVYLVKGMKDEILYSNCTIICDELGSPRRCGGQGDVLSGITGLFAAWVAIKGEDCLPNYATCAVAASALTRHCSRLAFEKYKRSMVAGNLIEFIGPAFQTLFETN